MTFSAVYKCVVNFSSTPNNKQLFLVLEDSVLDELDVVSLTNKPHYRRNKDTRDV